MVDITKCTGIDCPIKATCYRYTSKANDLWQSWMEPPGDEHCEYYLKVGKWFKEIFENDK